MVVRKVKLSKKIGQNKFTFHPESSADVIIYEENLTVKEVLDAIIDSVEQVENRLEGGPSVYKLDSNGNIITDGSGTGLVEIF